MKVLLLLVMATGLDAIGDSGWYTWRVTTNDYESRWCCADWSRGRALPVTCNLDGKGRSYTSDATGLVSSDEIQIYAQLHRGRVAQVHTLSPHCAVETKTEIRDLGLVDTGDSIDWLQRQVTLRSAVAEDALLAISTHEEAAALESLRRYIEDRSLDLDLREQALFWLVQSDSELGWAYLDDLLGDN